MAEKFYVTTAIDYVNAPPHIGHAYQKIVADTLARWNKLQGKDVLFVTGTDEHGKKVQEAAEAAGKKPKAFVDEVSKKFIKAWKALDIDYDRFIRTTDKDHIKVVKEFIEKCNAAGDIYKGEYSGNYCTGCELYVTEKDLVDGKCPVHPNRSIEKISEETYFFKLSKYQKFLLDLYKTDFTQPKIRRNEVKKRVEEGLNDLSITRTSFDWGIPFPLEKGHVTYVWFDALINYYTATREKGREDFWGQPTVHILGKDNTWFHNVYWPAFLKSAGIELPKTTLNHGFLTFNGQKISKSLGNSISPITLVDKYGVDAVRYFCLRQFSFASGSDGDFSETALVQRHNDELANKLGNLVSRTSALAEKYGIEEVKDMKISPSWKKFLNDDKTEYERVVKEINHDHEKTMKHLKIKDVELINHPQIENEIAQVFVKRYMESYEVDKALNVIFAYIDSCNEFLQIKKPWENSTDIEHRQWVLGEVVRAIREIAKLLSPFIPQSAEKISKIFKSNNIKKAPVLFQKIKLPQGRVKLQGTVSALSPNLNKSEEPKEIMEGVTTIQFNDFEKIDLRVAEIQNVEDIPKADKLYKLEISLGEEVRTICAGIKEFYSHDDLKGKKIIVVTNLAPRKLRGIESHGMLLAASSKDHKTVSLIAPDQDIEPGSIVG